MFNLSKFINKVFGMEKIAARESELEAERKKQGLSAGEDTVQKALHVDRHDKDMPVIESSLDDARSGSDADSVIEASIESHEGYTGRQPDKTDNYGDVTPMSVASESWDSAARDLYRKELEKMGENKSLLSKYIGDRHNIELKKKSIPAENYGLHNNPERFSSFDGIPVADATKNMKNYSSKPKIEKIASNIMDIDAMRFAIEYSAAQRGFKTQKEETILANLTSEKKRILSGNISV
jgi:hypothetical protein